MDTLLRARAHSRESQKRALEHVNQERRQDSRRRGHFISHLVLLPHRVLEKRGLEDHVEKNIFVLGRGVFDPRLRTF